MKKPHKTYFNWSSGKDASFALYQMQQDKSFDIDLLVTSINSHLDRVTMHGLRRELLVEQAESIGIKLQTIELPEQPTMEDYNSIMEKTVKEFKTQGYTDCGFGDIFLADLRTYRENQLKPYDIKCHFPLWKKDTKELLKSFIDLGFKTIVICVKSELLDESFVGREIDHNFINDLPDNVDPCGENGEFHTFCYDGPIFSKPVTFTIGENVFKEYEAPKQEDNSEALPNMGFWFCDLIPT
jgi:uncharacterized protein (TIGR00290 family)